MKKLLLITLLMFVLTSCSLPECIESKKPIDFTMIDQGTFDNVYKVKYDDGSVGTMLNVEAVCTKYAPSS